MPCICLLRYSYIGISLNELDTLDLHCAPGDKTNADGMCGVGLQIYRSPPVLMVYAAQVSHTCSHLIPGRLSLPPQHDLHALCPCLSTAGTCPITSGQQTIDSLGLDVLTIGQCAGILISYIAFFSTLAYIGVRYLKW
jgi:hypothetical protein